MNSKKMLLAGALSSLIALPAFAETEVTWWHAMSGQLGETVNTIAEKFNARQNYCKDVPICPQGTPLSDHECVIATMQFSD